MTKNDFCEENDLTNESDVERLFISRVINFLNYEDKDVKTKTGIKELAIAKGSSTENYKPDYALILRKKAVLSS